MYMIRDHGRVKMVKLGLEKLRLDNLQAAILNFKRDSYEDDVIRRSIAQQYQNELSSLKRYLFLSHQMLIQITLMYSKLEIVADDRDRLKLF